MRFYDVLLEKGVFLRPATAPNPAWSRGNAVEVAVLFRTGEERLRFFVDEEDYEDYVRPFRWCVGAVTRSRVYTSAWVPTGSGNSTVLLSRWLLNPLEEEEVDHVDLDPLNNRRSNLRPATRKKNQENLGEVTRGVSRHRGVFWDSGRWRAGVTHNYKAYKSPRFDSGDEAAAWAVNKRAELGFAN